MYIYYASICSILCCNCIASCNMDAHACKHTCRNTNNMHTGILMVHGFLLIAIIVNCNDGGNYYSDCALYMSAKIQINL